MTTNDSQLQTQDREILNAIAFTHARAMPTHLIESPATIKFCNELLLLRKTQR